MNLPPYTTRALVQECMVDRVRMSLIGRTHHEGARSGLRWLTNYIADNSTGVLSASEVRLMLAPMMGAR